jgi:hypothetical protein
MLHVAEEIKVLSLSQIYSRINIGIVKGIVVEIIEDLLEEVCWIVRCVIGVAHIGVIDIGIRGVIGASTHHIVCKLYSS